jgi:hypothetical protein
MSASRWKTWTGFMPHSSAPVSMSFSRLKRGSGEELRSTAIRTETRSP